MKHYHFVLICILVLAISCAPAPKQQIVFVTATPWIVTATPWIVTATPAPTNTPTVTPVPTQTATPTAKPLATIRVMSYNILVGGDVDPEKVSRQGFADTRLEKVLTIVKAANPDILGIQEANKWDKGTPPVAQRVANELGMNYFLAISKSGFHVALFTKFRIVATENLSDKTGVNHGALRATLTTLDGLQINVFVVHLTPFLWNTATRVPQVEMFTKEISPYTRSFAIFMGDMNFRADETQVGDIIVGAEEYQLLKKTGWHLGTGRGLIDQIWISPVLTKSVKELAFPEVSNVLYSEASDHFPVGVEIGIFPSEEKP